MYLYYFLSAFRPKMQPFLWWKRWGCENNDAKDTISLNQHIFAHQVPDKTADDPVCLRILPRTASPSLWLWLPQDCAPGASFLSHRIYLFLCISLWISCPGDVCKCSCLLCPLCKLLLLCLRQERSSNEEESIIAFTLLLKEDATNPLNVKNKNFILYKIRIWSRYNWYCAKIYQQAWEFGTIPSNHHIKGRTLTIFLHGYLDVVCILFGVEILSSW